MADDELNQSGEGEELEQAKARVAGFEARLAQKDGELAGSNARITELEQAVAEKDDRLSSLDSSLSQAVASYQALVVQANPSIPDEFIAGDTIEAINQSLEKAKSLVGKVRQELEAERAATKVPAGAPLRTPPDLGVLSPREKIQYAIGGRS